MPPVANHTPSLKITWDPNITNLTSETLGNQLRNGSPSIEIISWEEKESVKLTVFMLQAGEDQIVARRLREELEKASRS